MRDDDGHAALVGQAGVGADQQVRLAVRYQAPVLHRACASTLLKLG